MYSYVVTWAIDIEADSAYDAAKQAQDIQVDPESTATIFHVTSGDGLTATVNLETLPKKVPAIFNEVDRKVYQAAINVHEADTNEPIETYKHSVVESIDANGVMFASTEYLQIGEGRGSIITYKVLSTYLPK